MAGKRTVGLNPALVDLLTPLVASRPSDELLFTTPKGERIVHKLCGADADVHVAAIPEPTGNPPHVVFQTNLMATFNVLQPAIQFGVKRFVYISSETVPGFFFPEREFLPDDAPVDEEHPIHPQDPWAPSTSVSS